jgi:hypothetical protein
MLSQNPGLHLWSMQYPPFVSHYTKGTIYHSSCSCKSIVKDPFHEIHKVQDPLGYQTKHAAKTSLFYNSSNTKFRPWDTVLSQLGAKY